ncbi:hypothetical protein [Streptacidiphilus sp. MAP12-16]|uniref:hypothetical protein n=1 Tax=Streptacidiphilus sp. MAP12-16 TaxID=3156300 RepID=UPI003515F8D9
MPFSAPVGALAAVPVVDPRVVALQAEKQLALPRPVVAMSPSTFQVVNVPTWFWLDEGSLRPVSATVQVPGVAVTAVATAASVTWDPGDGGTPVECAGPGTPFVRGDDGSKPSPDCGYRYRRGSAAAEGGVFTVTVTAHWRVTWSGAGQGGVFPDLTTTAQVPVRVQEVQVLVEGRPGG